MNRPRIVHVPRRFVRRYWGGTETCILSLCAAMQERGFDAEILTSSALCSDPADEMDGVSIRRFGYSYTRLGLKPENRLSLDMRGGDLYSPGLFRYLLRAPNVRVIHLHTTNRVGAVVRAVSRLRKVPYFIHIHGGYLDIPREQMAQLTTATRGSLNWGKPLDYLLGRDRVLHDAAGIFCVCEDEATRMKEAYPKQNVWFLPNGISVERYKQRTTPCFRKQYQIGAEDTVILSVGGFYAQKNQLTLVEAFAEYSRQHPRAVLALVGAVYERSYVDSIRALAERLGIGKRVVILENLAYDDPLLVQSYRESNLFMLPSRYETFGIVVLEAWAAGLPVVCGAVGGLKSFVRDGRNGLFCDVDAKRSIAEKLELLGSDGLLRDRLVENATRDVADYDWGKITDNVISHYRGSANL